MEKVMSFLKAESLTGEVNVQERDTPEPATSIAEDSAEVAKRGNFDVIVGFGGEYFGCCQNGLSIDDQPWQNKGLFWKGEGSPPGGGQQSSFPRLLGQGQR